MSGGQWLGALIFGGMLLVLLACLVSVGLRTAALIVGVSAAVSAVGLLASHLLSGGAS